ncbi:MAG: OsmC family protein [Anaerolineales bacterium]
MSQEKRATVRLKQEMTFEGETGTGQTFILDASEGHGGQGAGARPMELLLAGLAGCTAMDVISILRKMKQPVEGFEVNVRGTRASEHPRVYTNIHLEYVIQGTGVEGSMVEKAIDLSVNKYCSASAMMKETADLTTSYRIK